MDKIYYFDLAKYQKDYVVAYSKFKEYIKYRVSDNVFDQWAEINLTADLAMKNAIMPAMEGYLINFFIKYNIKIGFSITKNGEYIPRVYTYNEKNGLYKNSMMSKYTSRNEAVLRAIDSAFAKLNVELIVNANINDK